MTAEAGGTVQLTAPTTTAPSASQSPTVGLAPNQAAVIHATNAAGASNDYWVRCLPPDFPTLDTTKHPENGDPTPGWYLLGNNILPQGGTTNGYAMILDTNGTPVWYKKSVPPAGQRARDPSGLRGVPGGCDHRPASRPIRTRPGTSTRSPTAASRATRPSGCRPTSTSSPRCPNGHHLMLSYPLRGGIDLTGLTPTPPVTPAPGPNSNIADCVIQDIDPAGQPRVAVDRQRPHGREDRVVHRARRDDQRADGLRRLPLQLHRREAER